MFDRRALQIAAFVLLPAPVVVPSLLQQRNDEPKRVRIRLTGQLEGRLEPCGCASGQLGGLARRSFSLKQDRRYDVLVEGGNLIKTASLLDLEKMMTALTVLSDQSAKYDVLGVGPHDFGVGTDVVSSFYAGFGLAAVASDLVADNEIHPDWPTVTHVEKRTEQGSLVRFASLSRLPKDAAKGFEVLDPQAAWTRALDGCPSDAFRVLMIHDQRDPCVEIAKRVVPAPDLVLGIGTAPQEPLSAPLRVERPDGTATSIVFSGTRGRYYIDVTIGRVQDRTEVTQYDTTALSGSKTAKGAMEDLNVRGLLLQHRMTVKESGLRKAMAEQRPAPDGRRYIGSQACGTCHQTAFAKWKETRHGGAWETLEKAEAGDRYGWPVTHYPDCVACHVVGYGEISGFISPTETPHLAGVGCEQCHGPGSEHIQNPMAGGLAPANAERCLSCHDYEQSPKFDWTRYWGKVAHGLEPAMQQARTARKKTDAGGKDED